MKALPVTFKSIVKGGKMPAVDRELFNHLLHISEGKTLTLTLDYYVQKRSNAQNSYYWPVVVEYVLEGMIDAGYARESLDSELVHDYLKKKFLKYQRKRVYNKLTRQYVVYDPSTTRCSVWEFMDYMEAVCQWAAEYLRVAIPLPDKKWKEEAERQYQMALAKGLITENERNRVRTALLLAAA